MSFCSFVPSLACTVHYLSSNINMVDPVSNLWVNIRSQSHVSCRNGYQDSRVKYPERRGKGNQAVV